MQIEEITFGDGPDKCLTLANEEWGRRLAVGSSWTRLRIGILFHLLNDGTNNFTTASIRVGMSPSKTVHIGQSNPSLWYGCFFGTTQGFTGDTFTYAAGGGNPHTRGAGLTRMRMLAGVATTGNNGGVPDFPLDNGAVIRKWPVVVELRKSGTSLIVSGNSFNNLGDAAAALTYTRAQLLDAMLNPVDLSTGAANLPIGSQSLTAGGATTFTNYTTDAGVHGELTAVHIGWNKAATPMRVFEIAASRLA